MMISVRDSLLRIEIRCRTDFLYFVGVPVDDEFNVGDAPNYLFHFEAEEQVGTKATSNYMCFQPWKIKYSIIKYYIIQIPLSIHVPEDEDVHIDLSTVRTISNNFFIFTMPGAGHRKIHYWMFISEHAKVLESRSGTATTTHSHEEDYRHHTQSVCWIFIRPSCLKKNWLSASEPHCRLCNESMNKIFFPSEAAVSSIKWWRIWRIIRMISRI